MANTPQDMEASKLQANLPVTQALIPEPEEVDLDSIESLGVIAGLTALQTKILLALARNPLLEIMHTDAQIAEQLGVSDVYIWKLRRHPRFTAALGYVITELAKGTQDKAFHLLMKHAQKDPGSVKTWLEMGGTFVRTQRNLNVNTTISNNAGQSKPLSVIVDDVLIRLGELGWSEDRVAELVGRFRELRDEGAF